MNKFSIRMLRKKKKKCLDESNETIERTNFALEYYTKKNCLDELNETIEGTNFILERYAKKKNCLE